MSLFLDSVDSCDQTDQHVEEQFILWEPEKGKELQQKLQNVTQRLAETRRRELEMNDRLRELMKSKNELEQDKKAVEEQLEQMTRRLADGYIRSRELYIGCLC